MNRFTYGKLARQLIERYTIWSHADNEVLPWLRTKKKQMMENVRARLFIVAKRLALHAHTQKKLFKCDYKLLLFKLTHRRKWTLVYFARPISSLRSKTGASYHCIRSENSVRICLFLCILMPKKRQIWVCICGWLSMFERLH